MLSRRSSLAARRFAASAAVASKPAAVASKAANVPVIKFEKEDMAKVVAEVPEFQFYKFGETEGVYPYAEANLTQEIMEPVTGTVSAPALQQSQLENGVKIASIDRHGATAQIGLYVQSGSRHDAPDSLGVSHMINLMSWRSTAHLSHLRTVKTLESLGATVKSAVDRESTSYTVGVLREYMPLIVPLLTGNVLFPRLLNWEVKAAREHLPTALEQASAVDQLVTEKLFHTGFQGGLGNPRLATPRCADHFEGDVMRKHLMQNFSSDRIAVIGVNVDHEQLSKWVMRSFVDYNAIPPNDRKVEESKYFGGYAYDDDELPNCHIALAFKTPGAAAGAAGAVLQAAMSGLTSSPTVQAMEKVSSFESLDAFNSYHSDAGLFGLYAQIHPADVKEATQAMASALKTQITADQVTKAKKLLRNQAQVSLQDANTLMNEMGRQFCATGKVQGPQEICSAIDAVSAADVQKLLTDMVKTPLTAVARGNLSHLPHYSELQKMF